MRKLQILLAALLMVAVSCRKEEVSGDNGSTGKLSVEIEVSDVSQNGFTVSFTPSDETPYIFGIADQASVSGYLKDMKRFIDMRIAEVMENKGSSRPEAAASLSATGQSTLPAEGLQPSTAYVCYAVGIDADGLYTTDVFMETVTTQEQDESAMFTVNVSDITSGSVTVSVIPEDNSIPYYYDIMTKADYESLGGDVSVAVEQMIDYIISYTGTDRETAVRSLQSTGPDSDEITGLSPSTEMVAFAVRLENDGSCPGTPCVTPFKTLDAGKPEDCRFSFGYDVSGNVMYITVTPTDWSTPYVTAVVKKSEFISDAELTARMYESIAYMAETYGVSVEEIVSLVSVSGKNETDYIPGTDFQADTEYYAFAYAINSDGTPAGQVYKDEFTSPSESGTVSDASVALENVRWFRGSDLAELDPEYGQIKDGAYLMADVTHSASAYSWYVALLPGDYTDAEAYPDETVYDAIVGSGTTPDKESIAYAVNYGPATALGFAMDSGGVPGEVYRLLIDVTEEGASPISEFRAGSTSHLDIKIRPRLADRGTRCFRIHNK